MNHDLETGSFSNSDDQDENILVPTPEMISKYNREYSTIVKEIDRFLKEAINSVQKFVTFHNFGVDFNLPQLLNSLNLASTNFRLHLNSVSQPDDKDPKKIAKNKYEVCFNNLVHRMGTLIKDMVDCQIEFKKSYFGTQNNSQKKQKTSINRSMGRVNRSATLTESSNSQKKRFSQFIQKEADQELKEAELRATLNQKLKPKAPACEPECKSQYSTTQNLYRLNEKIDLMLNDMKSMRSRQQKLIELFNLNRVKKLHTVKQESCPLNTSSISSIALNEDQDQEEVDEILEDWRARQSTREEVDDINSTKGFLKKRTIF